MHVLVTGGAGFIGSHVVDALVQGGHRVRVLDALHPLAHAEPPDYLNPNVEYRWGDLTDATTTRDSVAGVDAVCHHAAMVGLGREFADVDAYVHANDLGTARLLRALHDRDFRGPFVLASSMVVYGEGQYRCARHQYVRPAPRTHDAISAGIYDPPCPRCGRPLEPRPVTEDTASDPRSIYAATKLHQEHLCQAFGRDHGSAVTALRYHNVYGPRMPANTSYAGVASIFRSALQQRRPPRVFEDGAQLRDFVHVDDVATATVLALNAPEPIDGAINIATGTPRTVLQLAEALHRASPPGSPAPIVIGRTRPGDVRHLFGATDRAQDRLGFTARVTFEGGITDLARSPLRTPASRGSRRPTIQGRPSAANRAP
jgi:dTDP-L-rhamnose 4-epimerase